MKRWDQKLISERSILSCLWTNKNYQIVTNPHVSKLLPVAQLIFTRVGLLHSTSQDPKTDALPDTPALSIDTHYTSSPHYSTHSEDGIYYACDVKPSPILTSYTSILRSSPEYLMNKVASFAVTHSHTSQSPSNKHKVPPQSSPSTSSTDRSR